MEHVDPSTINGHVARIFRPFTSVALFLFIVSVEVPFLTFVCLNGLSAVASSQFINFMHDSKRVYDGSYRFTLADYATGNFWLLYVSIGFILAVVVCGFPLAQHFQYEDYLFHVRNKDRYAAIVAGHPELAHLYTWPSKTKPDMGNLCVIYKGHLRQDM